jgi:hypothetical protein
LEGHGFEQRQDMASLTSTNGNNQSSAHGKPDASAPQAGSVKLEDRARFDDSQHKLDELPPELVHIVDGFYPLGRLLERSAQECYNDLDETITALADIPAQINGEHATNSAGFVSAGNAQKRLRWIEFANTQRERFIKLLVLVRWSRQVNEVGKLIDIFNWMRTQDQLWDTVDDAMLNLRRTLETEKIRRPDLETALEILATGKSAKMPDVCCCGTGNIDTLANLCSLAMSSKMRSLPMRYSRHSVTSMSYFTYASIYTRLSHHTCRIIESLQVVLLSLYQTNSKSTCP